MIERKMARRSGRHSMRLGLTGLILLLCLITITIILTTIPVGRGAVGESTRKEEPPSATKTSFMMGTLVSIKAYGPNAQNAVDAAFARIRDIESEVSASLPDSEISELNLSAGKAPVRISRDTEILLREALRFARASGGKFDPTIGPLVKLWQIGTDKAHIPPAAEIEAAMHLVRYQDLIVNEKDGTAFLRRPGMAVDLGAIAKGYAGDEVIRILKDAGIRSGYVDLGGNVVVLGSKPDGTPWRVGVQDPRGERGDYVLAIPVVDKSVVTSGDYERYFEKDGVRYHHILDPFTGWPSRSGLISATIISDRSIDGDALSTTVFLLGPDKGMKLIEELPGIDGVLITTDKKILVSRGIQDKVEWPHGSSKYRYEKAAQ